MNTNPSNPLDGPPNPANHTIPPYGNPTVQVLDPPEECPKEYVDPVRESSSWEEFAVWDREVVIELANV